MVPGAKHYISVLDPICFGTKHLNRALRECALIMADIPIDGFAHLVTLVHVFFTIHCHNGVFFQGSSENS